MIGRVLVCARLVPTYADPDLDSLVDACVDEGEIVLVLGELRSVDDACVRWIAAPALLASGLVRWSLVRCVPLGNGSDYLEEKSYLVELP